MAAVFTDQGSSASFIQASKLLDAVAMLPGNTGGQSDAPQAFTQALLYGDRLDDAVETWIIIPEEQRPASWSKFRSPVVRLRLALYGHPLSGLFWEKHCHKQLKAVGFEPIPDWECCFVHKALQLVLSVYVDDFKMAGKSKTWTRAGS